MKEGILRIDEELVTFNYENAHDLSSAVGELQSIYSKEYQWFMADVALQGSIGELIYEDAEFAKEIARIGKRCLRQVIPGTEGLGWGLYSIEGIHEYPVSTKHFLQTTGFIVEAMNYQSFVHFLWIYTTHCANNPDRDIWDHIRYSADRVAGIRLGD